MFFTIKLVLSFIVNSDRSPKGGDYRLRCQSVPQKFLKKW